jgi:hypothetical protein
VAAATRILSFMHEIIYARVFAPEATGQLVFSPAIDLGVVDVMFCEIISLEGLFGGEKLDPQKFDYFVTGSCWGDCISQIPFAHNTQQDSKIKILQVWTKYYFQCNHLRLF